MCGGNPRFAQPSDPDRKDPFCGRKPFVYEPTENSLELGHRPNGKLADLLVDSKDCSEQSGNQVRLGVCRKFHEQVGQSKNGFTNLKVREDHQKV